MFYWVLLKEVRSESVPGLSLHDRQAGSSPPKWFLVFYLQMPIRQNYSVLWKEFKMDKKLQCSLDGIQNQSESKWNFAGNLSGFLCLASRHPVGLPFKGAESVEHWQCWFPSSQEAPPLLVPLTQAMGYPLSLGWGWRAHRRGVDPWPAWGKRGVTCL